MLMTTSPARAAATDLFESSSKVLVFELNEVPMRVLQHYAARHPGSAIARLLERARAYRTIAPDDGELSPWVSWPTVHRGVPVQCHGIRDLGQDLDEADRAFPPVWHLLAEAGLCVGVFGSMHSGKVPPQVERYSFYVPEVFAATAFTHPARFSSFQAFNLAMMDKNGRNASNEVPVRAARDFVLAAPGLGLRPSTALRTAWQLVRDRLNPKLAGRRRTLQAAISFDLFARLYRQTRPDCALFFSNHVASAMHRFWPTMFPGDYATQWWTDDWANLYSGEIDFALDEADRMVAGLLGEIDRNPDTALIVLGSIGQTATLGQSMAMGSQLLLVDPVRFNAALGARAEWQVRRHMVPLYGFRYTPQDADRVERSLRGLAINGTAVNFRRKGDEITMEFGQADLPEGEIELVLDGRRLALAESGLANVGVSEGVGSAAGHTPEGMMLIVDPHSSPPRAAEPPSLSTPEIAPALLRNFGIAPPAYMTLQ